LLQYTQDKVVLLDEDGRFTYANDATERILGWRPAELIGEDAFTYIHQADVEAARTAFETIITTDHFAQETATYRFRTAGDQWVWLESRMSNLTDDQLDGYVVSSRDVTDRVEAEEDRREIDTRLHELSATAGDVLWMFDGEWSELLFVNPAYESLYGQSAETLRGNPDAFLDAVHPDDVPVVEESMARLSAGTSVDIEYRVNPRRNYTVWVWVQAHPIEENGRVERITGFSRDVTDRHRRERQLFVMDTLLRHNLRNDLNIVLGHADHIEDEHPDARRRTTVIRRTCEGLLQSADKERAIIEAISERGSPEKRDSSDVIDDAVGTVRDRYPNAQLRVSTDRGPAVRVYAALETALVELLENAIVHHDGPTPRVSLETFATEDGVAVAVTDDAPTIPRMDAAVLTGDHDMDGIYHSSGLGLWLVYWIVDCCGGTIDLDVTGERGNEIVLRFPDPIEAAPIVSLATVE
jgi:PAS domain S-box-containing protein